MKWKRTKWSDIKLVNDNLLEYSNKFIDQKLLATYPLSFTPGAQFAVDKEKIICHGIDYHRLIFTNLSDIHPVEVHYMERLWDPWANCENDPLIKINYVNVVD